ncbi:hypothetical protein BZA77DRAFT_375024 [Pyronema omphalodes]|nr:hypothetical protein BZA77DRAFT_375024 [Pyronema omphalodes]
MVATTSKGRHSPFDCVECNRTFNTVNERLQHLYYDLEHWWRSPDLWNCAQCEGSSYMKDVKIFLHEPSGKVFAVRIPKHVCTGCGEEIWEDSRILQKQQHGLKKRMQLMSDPLTDVSENPLECTKCEKYFPTNTNVDAHLEYYNDKKKMLNGRAPDNLIYIEKIWRVHYHAALEKMLPSVDLLKKMEYIIDPPSREMLDGERHCINCHRKQVDIICFGYPCLYHLGNPILPKTPGIPESDPLSTTTNPVAYTCCVGKGTKECVNTKHHLYEDFKTVSSSLSFVQSPPRAHRIFRRNAVVLDCELGVNKDGGYELIQVCLMDFYTGQVLMCDLVTPNKELRHLNTTYSGITSKFFSAAKDAGDILVNWEAARTKVLSFVDSETIIIGHDLRQDLFQLRLLHSKILDTSLLFPKENGSRSSLVSLAKTIGGMVMRDATKGNENHSVVEDCMATRQIVCVHIQRTLGLA